MTEQKYCPSCKKEISSEDKFCRACGATLDLPTGNSSSDARDAAGKTSPPVVRSNLRWYLALGIGGIVIFLVVVLQPAPPTEPKPEPQHQESGMIHDHSMSLPENVQQEVSALNQMIQSDPNNLQALLRLANIYQDNAIYEDAITYYQRYIQLNPTNPDAHVDLGVTFFDLSRIDTANRKQYLTQAEQAMQKGWEINPKHQLACLNLGVVLLEQNNIDTATLWLNRCIAIDSASEAGRNATMLIHQHSFKNP